MKLNFGDETIGSFLLKFTEEFAIIPNWDERKLIEPNNTGILVDWAEDMLHKLFCCVKDIKIDILRTSSAPFFSLIVSKDLQTLLLRISVSSISDFNINTIELYDRSKKTFFPYIMRHVVLTNDKRQKFIDKYNQTEIDDFMED